MLSILNNLIQLFRTNDAIKTFQIIRTYTCANSIFRLKFNVRIKKIVMGFPLCQLEVLRLGIMILRMGSFPYK